MKISVKFKAALRDQTINESVPAMSSLAAPKAFQRFPTLASY